MLSVLYLLQMICFPPNDDSSSLLPSMSSDLWLEEGHCSFLSRMLCVLWSYPSCDVLSWEFFKVRGGNWFVFCITDLLGYTRATLNLVLITLIMSDRSNVPSRMCHLSWGEGSSWNLECIWKWTRDWHIWNEWSKTGQVASEELEIRRSFYFLRIFTSGFCNTQWIDSCVSEHFCHVSWVVSSSALLISFQAWHEKGCCADDSNFVQLVSLCYAFLQNSASVAPSDELPV